MEDYILQADESVIYKNRAQVAGEGGKGLEAFVSNVNTELLLTNLHLVFIHKIQKLLGKGQVKIEVYSIEEIKVYNGIPQVKQNDKSVEIYLLGGEKTLQFESKILARKFVNAVYELLTGKTMAARGADKVKGAVDTVDNVLGLDTVGTVKDILKGGLLGAVFGSGATPKKEGSGDTFTKAAAAAKMLIGKEEMPQKEKARTDAAASQLEILKKWKELLDADIISQEEFDAKKREILGL